MIKIRKSTKDDGRLYQAMCFDVYRDAYIYPELGYDESLLSSDIFFNQATTGYFEGLMTPGEGKTSFVAEDESGIVGGIVIYEKYDGCVISGFYVQLDKQGKGIGGALWKRAEEVISGRTIRLIVNAQAWRSVNMYFRRGFVIDPEHPREISHWEEWPEEKKFLVYGMIRKGTGNSLPS